MYRYNYIFQKRRKCSAKYFSDKLHCLKNSLNIEPVTAEADATEYVSGFCKHKICQRNQTYTVAGSNRDRLGFNADNQSIFETVYFVHMVQFSTY